MKNGTKFTGIFASFMIKLLTPLVLKVQTRATLEQKMMRIKNEKFRTIKKNHDHIKITTLIKQLEFYVLTDYIFNLNIYSILISNTVNKAISNTYFEKIG